MSGKAISIALLGLTVALGALALADAPTSLERSGVPLPVSPPPSTSPAATTSPSTVPSTAPATSPSTTPASRPAATTGATTTTASSHPVPKPYPPEFGILLTRSPFMRGPAAPPGPPQPPEATFGLRGVSQLDGQFVAMVENIAAKGVQMLKEGDKVAVGKVKSISMEGLVYEANGKSTNVTIGQNLLGAALPPLPPPPPPPPPAQPQGQPGQPGQPGGPQPGQPGGPPPGVRVRR